MALRVIWQFTDWAEGYIPYLYILYIYIYIFFLRILNWIYKISCEFLQQYCDRHDFLWICASVLWQTWQQFLIQHSSAIWNHLVLRSQKPHSMLRAKQLKCHIKQEADVLAVTLFVISCALCHSWHTCWLYKYKG